jgi:hypothetical protein
VAGAQLLIVTPIVAAALVSVVRFEQLCLRDLAQTPDNQLRLFTRAGRTALILILIPPSGLFAGRPR